MVTPAEEPYPVLVSSPVPSTTDADAVPASLEAFLASVGPRAFRFAEAGLRQRDDALDAVQDALLRSALHITDVSVHIEPSRK